MGAWREVGDGMTASHKYHAEAERDTLTVGRRDFRKAQKLIQKPANGGHARYQSPA